MTVADDLLAHAQGRALIGDTAYDSDSFARQVRRRGMKVVICCNPTRKRGRRRLDRRLYRRRYLVGTRSGGSAAGAVVLAGAGGAVLT
jgi:hypothetical protein